MAAQARRRIPKFTLCEISSVNVHRQNVSSARRSSARGGGRLWITQNIPARLSKSFNAASRLDRSLSVFDDEALEVLQIGQSNVRLSWSGLSGSILDSSILAPHLLHASND
jgi:hypothetical protein